MARPPEQKKGWTPAEIAITAAIAGLAILWATVVGLSAAGFNLFGVEWDYERTGQLGDSFGVVGALMATAAAAFTFRTLTDERSENSRLRDREGERDRADRKREAEATFFQLLDLRNSILERVRDPLRPTSHEAVSGQRAIKAIANGLALQVTTPSSDQQRLHDEFWSKVEGEVGHYLRFTYHIIGFATANFDNERDRYGYVRLLRAQLSNAELQLIALNSAYGAGNPHMKARVERYALLHSLPDETIDRLRLRSLFDEKAFNTDRWLDASTEPS